MSLEINNKAFYDELSKIAQCKSLLLAMDKYAEHLESLPLDKYAASLGFAAAKAGNGVNPTLAGVEQAQGVYNGLDSGLKKLIESHPLVTQHGMAPHAAMQVAGWSMKPNQTMGDFFAQQHLQGGAPPASAGNAISGTMATRMPMNRASTSVARPAAAAATNVGGKLTPAAIKMTSAPVAGAANALAKAKPLGAIAKAAPMAGKAPGLQRLAMGLIR